MSDNAGIKKEKVYVKTKSLLNKYTNLINNQKSMNIVINDYNIPIPTGSFYKICNLVSLSPEEEVRFTFYADEDEEKVSKISNEPIQKVQVQPEFQIPNAKNIISYEQLEKYPRSEDKTEQAIPPALANSCKRRKLWLIYPLLIILSIIRCVHLYYLSKRKGGFALTHYEIANGLMIIVTIGTSIYGIYQVIKLKMENFLPLNMLLFACIIFCIFCFLFLIIPMFPKNVEFQFYEENSLNHFIFFILLLVIELIALILNILIQRDYEGYLRRKNNKLIDN